jgi:hypothetical protein
MDARVKPGHDECFCVACSKHGFAISPRHSREFYLNVLSSEIRGRRECRALDAPAASRAKLNKAHERSHHRSTGNHPAFPAQWFYGLLRALPGDQACLTPSPALLIADLTPASGRQNDTTSPYASARFVKRTDRVHRIPPRVDDVAQRPSEGRDRIAILLILPRRQAKLRKFRNRPECRRSGPDRSVDLQRNLRSAHFRSARNSDPGRTPLKSNRSRARVQAT